MIKNTTLLQIQRSVCTMLILLLAMPTIVGANTQGQHNSEVEAVNESTLRFPEGIIVLQDDSVLVADTMNHRIRLIKDGTVSTYAGLELFSANPNIPLTGALLDGSRETAVFNAPKGLAVDGRGNVYVADASNHAIRKISSDGQITTVAGDGVLGNRDSSNGKQARFYHPSDVAVAKDGTLYVTDTLNHLIRKITPNGTVTTLNSASNRMIEIGPEVTEAGGYKDGSLSEAQFNEPSGIAMDSKGNLFVADSGNHLIRYIDLTHHTVTTLAGNSNLTYTSDALYAPGGYQDGDADKALFNFPKGMAITDEGGLIIADSMNHRVRYLFNGKVTTLAGINQLEYPTDVAVLSDGSIVIADTYQHQIHLLTPSQLPSSGSNQQIVVVYGTEVIDMDTAPEMKNGRTMVPVRAVSEHLGFTVKYDAKSKRIRLEKQDITLQLTVGNKQLELQDRDGKQVISMDAVPYIQEGRLYVPLRFFSEAFGYDVKWDATTQTVFIQ